MVCAVGLSMFMFMKESGLGRTCARGNLTDECSKEARIVAHLGAELCRGSNRPRLMRRVALALLAAISSCAFAHEVGELAPPPLWHAWNRDWWLWLLIAFSGWLYARGVRRLWAAAESGAGISAMQVAAFALGWLALIVALLSPLDVLSAQLFSAHMVQHELLMIVAAPLLILGHPLGPFIWALPPRWRKPAADLCRELGL